MEAGLLAAEAFTGPAPEPKTATKGGTSALLGLAAAFGATVVKGDDSVPYGW